MKNANHNSCANIIITNPDGGCVPGETAGQRKRKRLGIGPWGSQ